MPSPLRICRCHQCRKVRRISPDSHVLIRKQARAHRHLVRRLLHQGNYDAVPPKIAVDYSA